MEIKKVVLSTALSLLVSITGLAQSAASSSQSNDRTRPGSEDSEKKAVEKKALALIDEILKDAAALRLPENRIRLQASAADLLWKHNEKRARELFKLAMDGLSEILVEGAADGRSSGWSRMPEYPLLAQSRAQLRQEILQMIALRDAKMARDFLRSTRSPSNATAGERDEYDQDLHTALGLAAGIAATDPAQALQIAEESLEAGVQQELAAIVYQLAAKDKATAEKLVVAVMKRLRTTNLSTDRAAGSLALMLLRMALPPRDDDPKDETTSGSDSARMLDDKTIRELMEILSSAALAKAPPGKQASEDDDAEDLPYLLDGLHSMMGEIQKYVPALAEALNKRFAEFNKKLDPDTRAMVDYQQLIERGDLNSLVEATAKAPAEMRDSLWGQVAMRAMNDGDVERARQIVTEHFDGSAQGDELLAQIDAQTLRRAADAGKLEDARELLTRVPLAERVSVLTQLALSASIKGDKKAALRLLDEARGMIGERAVNAAELNAMLEIARAYATVEPARSFEIMEPLADQLNTLLAAAALLDGFEYLRYFKDGELLPQNGQSLLITVVAQCENDMGQLARSDFDRAKTTADRFQAPEVRLMARLSIARGILANDLPRTSFSGFDRIGPYAGRLVID
jgi:hypothetical protein